MTVAPGLPAPPFPSRDLPTEVVLASLGLSTQDQLWVTLYRQTGDAMASCVRAKMSDPAWPTDVLAMKTLERSEIQRAIELLDKHERETAEAAAAKSQAVAARMPPVEITRDSVVANLQEVFEQAMPALAFGAAIASQKTIASINGWLKQTVDVNIGFKRPEDMTDDELERIIKQGAKGTISAQYKDVTPEEDE